MHDSPWTLVTLPAYAVAKYCDEYVYVCVCVSARISQKPHTRSLPNFMHVAMALARTSYGVVAIRYVLPVLWMIISDFLNGPYSGTNFGAKDRFRLNLLICRKVGQNSISYY